MRDSVVLLSEQFDIEAMTREPECGMGARDDKEYFV